MIRELVCDEMDYLGIKINTEKNKVRSGKLREIQSETSKVKILVIPTNEEAEIAKQAYNLINK